MWGQSSGVTLLWQFFAAAGAWMSSASSSTWSSLENMPQSYKGWVEREEIKSLFLHSWIDLYIPMPKTLQGFVTRKFCSVGVFDMKHYLQLDMRLPVSKNLSNLAEQPACNVRPCPIWAFLRNVRESWDFSGNFPLDFGRPTQLEQSSFSHPLASRQTTQVFFKERSKIHFWQFWHWGDMGGVHSRRSGPAKIEKV